MCMGMNSTIRVLLLLFAGGLAQTSAHANSGQATERVRGSLELELSARGLSFGDPIFIRVFKEPGVLEVWVEGGEGHFELFKSYEICSFSGELGPKLRSGDIQSPEGFYFVTLSRLAPWSRYHLAFNIGYPNAYDRFHQRTGDSIMIHGDCVSIGCYAMTDAGIEEIYALTHAALSSEQPFVRVHIFPFRLNDAVLDRYADSEWHAFWLNLKQGFDYFELHGVPPNVEVDEEGRYVFD